MAQPAVSVAKKKQAPSLLEFLYKHGTLLAILVVIAYFGITQDRFFTYENFSDILRSISIVTLVAIGITFSLIVDGFDLSVGSTVSLEGMRSRSRCTRHAGCRPARGGIC